MTEFYVVWPASNGTAPLVKGPFSTLAFAADARQVNGDIVCTFIGNTEVAEGLIIDDVVVVPPVFKPTYQAVQSKDWLWDWEDSESSPFSYRFATQGGTIT